ncbi:MAG: UbiD family decarboxylase [Lachnospiraceae bacterium]|jgi:UbiD family decarboxylase
MSNKIYDLRSALEALKKIPGEVLECNKEVDPYCQLTGIYHKVGVGGTSIRPTKIGPMMIFNKIKGFPETKIAIGVVGTRERVAHLLETDMENLGRFYLDSLNKAVDPVEIPNEQAKCQEEVYLATDPDFDIRKILPPIFTTPTDAGSFVTMGLLYASDPDDRNSKNAAIHRMCIQDKDRMTVGFGGHRHLGVFKDKAHKKGEPLQVSVSVGIDPAIYLASCFEPPTTPLGFDELTIAGAMRGTPVELTRCKAIDELCIANAEYVIEGEMWPDELLEEDYSTGSGRALPEFPGYAGPSRKIPVFRVKAITKRKNAIWQCCIGQSEEHVNMAGIPSEASALAFLDKALPGLVKNAYAPPSGGGKFNMILQICKKSLKDEGNQRHAALSVFAVLPEVKNVFLVDDDVDIFDPYDVEWALTTRFRPDKDMITIPGIRCHIGDPTAKKYYDQTLYDDGIAHKAIYDATCPFEFKDRMWRPRYIDVDINDFI